MTRQFVISVMSKDRPGIIADISGAIYDLGGDLADLNQSVLGGYFTMILIAEFEENITPEDIVASFSHIRSETRPEVTVKEMEAALEIEKENLPGETYILTVRAENRKGLVKTVGDFLYNRNINVLDLATTRENNQYTMIFQIDLSLVTNMKKLRNDAHLLEKTGDLELLLQHNDVFKATHEIKTPFNPHFS